MWLEWAGATLLSLGGSSPLPKGPRVLWPDFPQDATIAYGYSNERLRVPKSSAREIEAMDEILLLPNSIHNITTRRIVNARLLVTPVTSRYLYSWSKLSIMLHMDRRRIVAIHRRGLHEIISKTDAKKAYALRQRLGPLSLYP